MLLQCNLDNLTWLHFILTTVITSCIGAMGAFALDSESKNRVFGYSGNVNSESILKETSSTVFNEWRKKHILAFIASACTPLVLELMDKTYIICSQSDEKCHQLIYIGYALILATFGETIVKVLGEILGRINNGVQKMLS